MNNFSPEFGSQEDDALYRAVDEFERWPVETEPADNILIEAVVDFQRFNATPPVERGKFDLSVKTKDQYVCLLNTYNYNSTSCSTAVRLQLDDHSTT